MTAHELNDEVEGYSSGNGVASGSSEVESDIPVMPIGGKKHKKGAKKSAKKGAKKTAKKGGKKGKKTKKVKGKKSTWITHVLSFAKARKLKFPDALKHPDCKKTYKK